MRPEAVRCGEDAHERHRVRRDDDLQFLPRCQDESGSGRHAWRDSALASFHKCDYLLTWNCRHLANANKFNHIRRVNTLLGLSVPTLATPLELTGGEESP